MATRQRVPFAWREVVTEIPRAVWAITALHLALLLFWSILAPIYRAPDEPQHIDLARAVAMDWSYPEYDERRLSRQVTESFRVSGFSDTADVFDRNREPVIAVDAPPRDERPSFHELAPDEPSRNANPAPQHPPLYYAAGALVVSALPDGAPFDLVAWALRVLSVLCLAPVPLLVFAAGRRLSGQPVVGILAAVLLLGVPQYLHIGGAVNPDNLLTLQFAALLVPLLAVAQGDLGWRTAVWIGLLTALALMTKGFALVLPVWVASAYVIGIARTRRLADGVRAAAIAGLLGGLLGGLWWLRNIVVHGTVQTTVQSFPDATSDFDDSFGAWAEHAFGFLADRFWGSFGWVEVTLSDEVVTWAGWTGGVLIALAFVLRPRRAPWWRADLILALIPFITILAIIAYGSYETYAQAGRITGMQGRYLFPGLPGLALVAALGPVALLRRWSRPLPLVALAAVGWMQWLGIRLVLFFWYGHPGIESPRISGAALVAWAPVPRPVSAAILGGVALASVWVLVELVLLIRRAPAAPADRSPGADGAEAVEGVDDTGGADGADDTGGADDTDAVTSGTIAEEDQGAGVRQT